MSRTVFSGRFRDLVGQTPIRYLTGARLGRAAGYLATTNQSLHAIARRTGYDSEASFSKAFKREFGRSPGEYRRQIAAKPILIGAEAAGPPASDAG
jgi:transcriptional regulator GlxA family with amidase domain